MSECRLQSKKEKHLTLACVASDFYPDHVSVTWFMDRVPVEKGVSTDPEALRAGSFYTITSRLRVSPRDWSEGRNFTCRVGFFNGIKTDYFPKFILGHKHTGQRSSISREQYLKATQAGKLSYVVLICKSFVYGLFVAVLLWRCQRSNDDVK